MLGVTRGLNFSLNVLHFHSDNLQSIHQLMRTTRHLFSRLHCHQRNCTVTLYQSQATSKLKRQLCASHHTTLEATNPITPHCCYLQLSYSTAL